MAQPLQGSSTILQRSPAPLPPRPAPRRASPRRPPVAPPQGTDGLLLESRRRLCRPSRPHAALNHHPPQHSLEPPMKNTVVHVNDHLVARLEELSQETARDLLGLPPALVAGMPFSKLLSPPPWRLARCREGDARRSGGVGPGAAFERGDCCVFAVADLGRADAAEAGVLSAYLVQGLPGGRWPGEQRVRRSCPGRRGECWITSFRGGCGKGSGLAPARVG